MLLVEKNELIWEVKKRIAPLLEVNCFSSSHAVPWLHALVQSVKKVVLCAQDLLNDITYLLINI